MFDNIFNIVDGFWQLMLGMGILMLVNIILGSLSAMLKKGFNWKKFAMGFLKAGIIVLCYFAVYIAGAINIKVLTLTIGDAEVNVVMAIYLVVLNSARLYVKQLIDKLKVFTQPQPIDVKPIEVIINNSESTNRDEVADKVKQGIKQLEDSKIGINS